MTRPLALLIVSLASFVPTGGAQDLDSAARRNVADITRRLRTYLVDYEAQLGALVAEERFEQSIRTVSGDRLASGTLRDRRVLVSEIGFLRLPGDGAWLAHRSVQSVNGRPVRTGAPDLRNLYASTGNDQAALARQIAEENARHNIGHPRTMNVPTLPLELLHPRHESVYAVSVDGVERRGGPEIWRLDFHEGATGSIVAHDQHRFARTLVRAWIEAATGALMRAEVTLIPPAPARANHVVLVEFEPDPQLGLRVPTRLRETFWASGSGEGRATYRNYRRFETGARIVKPGGLH